MSSRRSQPEHVGPTAQAVAAAHLSAFGSGIVATRAYVEKRALRPHTYLKGAVVEVFSACGPTQRRYEHAADAGAYVTDRMRALEKARDLGAEVKAYIERPGQEPGSMLRETLVHRKLVRRAAGDVAWEEVALARVPTLVSAVTTDENDESDADDEGGSDAGR